MQLIQLIKQGNNPQQLLMNILQQNGSNNPILKNAAASQNAQTGQILNDNAAQTTALLRALNPAPVPAYVVPNPVGCNCGNGCGGNGFYN